MAKLRNDTTVGGDPIKSHIDDLADDEYNHSDQIVQDHFNKIVRTDPQIVEDSTEASNQRGTSQNFEDVFNEWRRFSHYRGNETTNNLNSWNFDSANNEVYSTQNTPELIGFVSPDTYNEFIFDVTISSREEHGNYIGLVIAFAEDGSGNEHTLTAMRAPGTSYNGAFASQYPISEGPGWIIAYDLHGQDHSEHSHEWIPRIALYYESAVDNYASDGGNASIVDGTSDWYYEHCRIRIERNNDDFTVMTTDFGDTTDNWVSGATFTFNLNDYPELDIFKGGSSIGYCAQSEPGATYVTNRLPTKTESVYDVANNTLWTYDASTDTWSSSTPDEDIYPNRIHWNSNFNRLYFVDKDKQIFRLAMHSDLP